MHRTTLRAFSFGRKYIQMSPKNVVFITGCDSGLGFSLAVLCHSLNMTVVSACHNIKSQGALMLQDLNERMVTIELDLLKDETIMNARRRVDELIRENRGYQLTALVNNAGVMCFGEFEWQTHKQISAQIGVNVLGTMHMTKELLPLLRQHHGRIININSHCSLQALPTLAAYAASKAALRLWNDALRIEMHQYGVKVVNFIPGSFVTDSNISARQQDHAEEMFGELSMEQKNFYGSYFRRYNKYLSTLSGFKPPDKVKDNTLLLKFKDALMSTRPKTTYIHEPLRYKIYHILFRICPTTIADLLAIKFCAMPRYYEVGKSLHTNTAKNATEGLTK